MPNVSHIVPKVVAVVATVILFRVVATIKQKQTPPTQNKNIEDAADTAATIFYTPVASITAKPKK